MENDFYTRYAEDLYYFVTHYLYDEYSHVKDKYTMAQFVDNDPDIQARFYAFVTCSDVV